ncbi:hypothetical protein [Streptomyces sp. GS7]|uniref:hypothetical protein n=1 Tax=Streptomyces sp. GS7 TaxID=2692234 RepID=UPI001318B0F0|nr:hypothetical protein [Streptomyces sp. GS7]QHC22460.1 hypothetical protein GR130_14490 [Streptomyces sp. GS7]
MPSAIVADIGRTDGRWAVDEANAARASGRCIAHRQTALDTVLRAAGPRAAVVARDLLFVRRTA